MKILIVQSLLNWLKKFSRTSSNKTSLVYIIFDTGHFWIKRKRLALIFTHILWGIHAQFFCNLESNLGQYIFRHNILVLVELFQCTNEFGTWFSGGFSKVEKIFLDRNGQGCCRNVEKFMNFLHWRAVEELWRAFNAFLGGYLNLNGYWGGRICLKKYDLGWNGWAGEGYWDSLCGPNCKISDDENDSDKNVFVH